MASHEGKNPERRGGGGGVRDESRQMMNFCKTT